MGSELIHHDGAWLAAMVRSLAGDVHRLATLGSAEAHEIARLAGRIRQVRAQLRGGATSPLHRWLDRLQQELDAIPAREPAWS